MDARTLSTDLGTVRQLLRTAQDNPIEDVHPADVATAVGKILLIGGDESCRITQHEFLDAALGAAGLRVPRDLFGSEPFYTHWMNTSEADAILGFQHHTFADYRAEMHARLRWVRPLAGPGG